MTTRVHGGHVQSGRPQQHAQDGVTRPRLILMINDIVLEKETKKRDMLIVQEILSAAEIPSCGTTLGFSMLTSKHYFIICL